MHTSTTSTQSQSHIIAPPSTSAITGSNPNDKNEFATREMLMSSTIKHSLNLHQRSQSLSGLQLSKSYTDSPKHATGTKMGSQLFLPQTSAEAQLKHENDRLKIALAQRYVLRIFRFLLTKVLKFYFPKINMQFIKC